MLDNYICRIAINFMPKLNRVSMLPLWERAGGFPDYPLMPEDEWQELCSHYGVMAKYADRASAIKSAMAEASLMERYGINLLCYDDYNYPQLLRECSDAPLILYYKGTLYNEQNNLAIVGTRSASHECKEVVREIVGEVSKCIEQPIIISGLAHGIDICAQRAAISNNLKSYAVVAHGLGTLYPAANREFAKEMVENKHGAIISEYPCNRTPQKGYFLERNRIIAGMSNWLLVGESGIKGGSMVTAKIAFSYGREIMAVPGSPLSYNSKGCNQLIKHNMAYLVENGNDVIECMGLTQEVKEKQLKLDLPSCMTPDETLIYDLLKRQREPLHYNEIAKITGITIEKLAQILLNMEINSLIYALAGENYKICK